MPLATCAQLPATCTPYHGPCPAQAVTLGDAVARPNPERRLIEDYDFRAMLEAVEDWEGLYVLQQELLPRYGMGCAAVRMHVCGKPVMAMFFCT